VEKKKALLLKSIILCKDVRELEEIDHLQPKVNKSEIKDIKNKILATDTRIKEQMAIQKRSKDTMELKEDLKNKLTLARGEFEYNFFPALNQILKVIGMAPLQLGSVTENSADFLEQLMVIEQTIEVAEQVLTAAENNTDSETSYDEIENEVFVSSNTSESNDDEDTTIIPASQRASGSHKPVLDEVNKDGNAKVQEADDEKQKDPYTAVSRKQRRVYFDDDA